MEKFDLIIIGAGSGNSVLTPDFDDWKVALVERDVFGGTCLNRGCIPSKMFIYPASIVESVRTADRLGVDAQVNNVRWGDMVQRVFGRIDPIAESGGEWRRSLDNITVFAEDARFVGEKQLQVGDQVITADTIVLAAGARPRIPDIPGLADVRYHTSASMMRVPQAPKRLGVLGGGFIAVEMSHMFQAAGSEVTIMNRSHHLLRAQDDEVSERFTEVFAERFNLQCGESPTSVRQEGEEIIIEFPTGNPVVVDELLVATGRVPNGEQLQVAETGVAIDDSGYVVVDEHQRTNVEGIWALGDISNRMQLKHTANAETRVVAHNIHHPDDLKSVNYSGTPSAVFSHPQVATVGKTERELKAEGVNYIAHTQPYSATAYGWAMEDDHGFCKVICDADTRLLLGAHIIGHEASLLIGQLIFGIRFGLTVDEMARDPLYIHPALSEVVEQALLEL